MGAGRGKPILEVIKKYSFTHNYFFFFFFPNVIIQILLHNSICNQIRALRTPCGLRGVLSDVVSRG